MEKAIPEIMTGEMTARLIMYENNSLDKYLHPMDCPTRRQELQATTVRPNARRPKAQGAPQWLRMLQEESDAQMIDLPKADISEMHLLEYAFKRRGIALHLTGLMSYVEHEGWRRKLFRAMRQTPPHQNDSPPGVEDILAADKHIWTLLAEECLDGIKETPAGRPLETALEQILACYEVQSILTCRLRGGTTGGNRTAVAAKPTDAPQANGQTANSQPAKTKAQKNKEKRQRRAGKKAAQKNESMQKELQALRKKVNLPGNTWQAQRWQAGPTPKKGRKGKFVPSRRN